jgi:hypothetical protein
MQIQVINTVSLTKKPEFKNVKIINKNFKKIKKEHCNTLLEFLYNSSLSKWQNPFTKKFIRRESPIIISFLSRCYYMDDDSKINIHGYKLTYKKHIEKFINKDYLYVSSKKKSKNSNISLIGGSSHSIPPIGNQARRRSISPTGNQARRRSIPPIGNQARERSISPDRLVLIEPGSITPSNLYTASPPPINTASPLPINTASPPPINTASPLLINIELPRTASAIADTRNFSRSTQRFCTSRNNCLNLKNLTKEARKH